MVCQRQLPPQKYFKIRSRQAKLLLQSLHKEGADAAAARTQAVIANYETYEKFGIDVPPYKRLPGAVLRDLQKDLSEYGRVQHGSKESFIKAVAAFNEVAIEYAEEHGLELKESALIEAYALGRHQIRIPTMSRYALEPQPIPQDILKQMNREPVAV